MTETILLSLILATLVAPKIWTLGSWLRRKYYGHKRRQWNKSH